MGVRGSRRESLVVVALCAAWYAVGSAGGVVSKLALAQLPFPATLALAQLAGVALLGAPALAAARVRPEPAWPRRYYWRVLVPLAGAKLLTTLCSQVSLWKVPVSYAHTVKATTPLWTAALARAVLGQRESPGALAALLVIAGGVALASATELRFHALGLGAALAAAALLAAQHLASKRVLRDSGAHPLRLLAALARLALLALAPLWALRDARALAGAAPPAGWPHAAALLAADAALAWLQAVCAFSVLARVSPLSYAVASAAKRAAVIGASLLALRNPAPPANVAGMALAALGVLLYQRTRARAAPPPPHRAPLLPV